jgi:hypothetical protein
MKFQVVLPAVLFAAVSSLAMSAYAEDAMKPHSHMEEKTGIAAPKAKAAEAAPAAAAEAKPEKAEQADKPKAEGKKNKHYHPRDGK